MKLSAQQPLIILAVLMAATRMHHFGSAMHFPDASLAVFLLAGFVLTSPLWFVALLAEAAALDYFAIAQLDIDNYCMTPAYGFLIPTYGALWLAGRYYAGMHQRSLKSLGIFATVSFIALNVAFVISNGSFYLFSGRYPGMGVVEYCMQMLPIYLPYMSSGAMYLACAAALYAAFTSRSLSLAK